MRALLLAAVTIAFTASALHAAEFPPELTQFRQLENQPVFAGAGPGHWDARLRERGYILRDGDAWRMWYTGYAGERGNLKMLGLATSADGIKWSRSPENPLYREHWVEDVCVVQGPAGYVMIAEGFFDRLHSFTSPDGVKWTREGLVDVRLRDGSPIAPGPYGTPTLWYEDGVWNLFYERRDAGVWLARSTDRKVWTNVQDEPVLSPGPEAYDRHLIAMNQVIRYDGRYYAVFHGSGSETSPAVWATGLAVSEDLVQWKKYPGNPLLPVEENKSSGLLIPWGDRFRLYTMHDRVFVHESSPLQE